MERQYLYQTEEYQRDKFFGTQNILWEQNKISGKNYRNLRRQSWKRCNRSHGSSFGSTSKLSSRDGEHQLFHKI